MITNILKTVRCDGSSIFSIIESIWENTILTSQRLNSVVWMAAPKWQENLEWKPILKVEFLTLIAPIVEIIALHSVLPI